MAPDSVPKAFSFLAAMPNRAVDAALVDILPELDRAAQIAALEILLKRNHPASLAHIVARFETYQPELQALILSQVSRLGSGLRFAMTSDSQQRPHAAIALIVRGGCTALAYLLAEALRNPSEPISRAAAAGLLRLTETWLDSRGAKTAAIHRSTQADHLAEALNEAIRGFETHKRTDALRAALWMADRTESVIRRKLAEARSTLGGAIMRLLESGSDPRLAGFVLRALAMSPLRSTAVRTLCRSSDSAFFRAIVSQSWLLADPAVERGCRSVPDGPWRERVVSELLELEGATAACGVRLLMATAGSRASGSHAVRTLIGTARREIRQSVAWQLVHQDNEAAENMLLITAVAPEHDFALMAARELRRRHKRRGIVSGITGGSLRPSRDPARQDQAFERLWASLDELNPRERQRKVQAMSERMSQWGCFIRAQLASSDVLDRVRALQLASQGGLAGFCEEAIHRLTHDSASVVRSFAVGLLAELPGATTIRLLRTKVNDPDERVQAVAIEVLDRLDRSDRVDCTRPKLGSPDGRVRATAVKSLLRAQVPEAGDGLLDMLEDSLPSHRLSALWVIERLGLQSASERVKSLSGLDPDVRVRKRARHVERILACGSLVPAVKNQYMGSEEGTIAVEGLAP